MNDIVILDPSGRLVLPARGVLVNAVSECVVGGNRKILLNLSGLEHVDSSGIEDLCRALSLVRAQGGTLKVFSLAGTVRGLFQVTRLYTIFDVFDDEASALRSFEMSRYCKCPSCGNLSVPPSLDPSEPWREQNCSTCNARFSVNAKQEEQGRVVIKSLRFETYALEYLEIVPGFPYTVRVAGRFNLFSSSTLDRAWRAIPEPRRVIFDLSSATAIDNPGWEALLRFLGKKELGAKAVVFLAVLKQELPRNFLEASDVYSDMKSALAALGDVSDTPKWVVETVNKS